MLIGRVSARLTAGLCFAFSALSIPVSATLRIEDLPPLPTFERLVRGAQYIVVGVSTKIVYRGRVPTPEPNEYQIDFEANTDDHRRMREDLFQVQSVVRGESALVNRNSIIRVYGTREYSMTLDTPYVLLLKDGGSFRNQQGTVVRLFFLIAPPVGSARTEEIESILNQKSK